jgi:predicted MPP superfamily phosphohydrolase
MEQTYSILLSIAGTLIVLLLTIIGFFLKQRMASINISDEAVQKLDKAVDKLIYTLNDFKKSYDKSHAEICRKLEDHEHRISKNSERIIEIRSAINN